MPGADNSRLTGISKTDRFTCSNFVIGKNQPMRLMITVQLDRTKLTRRHKPTIRNLVLFTLINLSLVGCDTVSFMHPPGEVLAVRDQRLEGAWLFLESDDYRESGLIIISFDEDKGRIQARAQSLNDDEEPNLEELVVVLYTEGNKKYLSFRKLDHDQSESYQLMSYRIRGEKLLIRPAEVEPFIMAIEFEVIKGKVDHRDHKYFSTTDAVVTDTEEQTRNLVIRNHESIFIDDPIVLSRYKWHESEFRGR